MDRLRAATRVGISCWAGVGEWDGHERPEEFWALADRLLYSAMRRGRRGA